MHPFEVRDAVRHLHLQGLPDRVVAERLQLARETVRDWRRTPLLRRMDDCPLCGDGHLQPGAYAYLLGLYLGDGHIALHRRGVYHLRITLDARYRGIIAEAARAMALVAHGRRIGLQPAPGCIVVGSYWKHWPCLFPQHGPGPKHRRRIELVPFQQQVLRSEAPRLLRGLIHSDGCRVLNRVAGREYPRYHFSNRSDDIRSIFCTACDTAGVRWTQSSFKEISVARATAVAKLDQFIGPKR